jgi:bifunctional non-homologous end joining protein LigD
MAIIEVEGIVITITNPTKVLFPISKITKWDLTNYYLNIADYILPFVRNRPVTINCFARGIDKEGFYRQHAPVNLPEWLESYELSAKKGGTVTHILCQNKASLVYLANQNMVAIHRWLSTTLSPETPDLLVVDLDPPPGKFVLACKAAKLLKIELEHLHYKPYVMTTGSRGLHVICKVQNTSFEEIRTILYQITSKIANEYPQEFSVEVRKKERENLVYLDITRNAYGQTAIAPFSARAKEYAPVATPISWEELEKSLSPNQYNIHNIFTRLEAPGTAIWHDF